MGSGTAQPRVGTRHDGGGGWYGSKPIAIGAVLYVMQTGVMIKAGAKVVNGFMLNRGYDKAIVAIGEVVMTGQIETVSRH
ncbi:hypothetical protein GALL_513920 [mine drainage metagenome]|uniref:Uncharacterized protein n=1 Tax=mine drainage metagenome TaxID=410659 RepID=A0A1J5PP20_9ZZZZ